MSLVTKELARRRHEAALACVRWYHDEGRLVYGEDKRVEPPRELLDVMGAKFVRRETEAACATLGLDPCGPPGDRVRSANLFT